MEKCTGIFLVLLCLAAIFVAGCTSPGSMSTTNATTPTPQIVYVTVLVTPTLAVTPEETEPSLSEEVLMDEAFLDYLNGNQIFEAMATLETATPGSYSISTGYNGEPKKEAIRLTTLLYTSPPPGSEKMKTYRSAMMDALSMMDGSTAGFTRYRDAMQTVIMAKNAALFEMHASGSSSVDAVHLIGYGTDVRSWNVTETGQKTFAMHHSGDRNFAITLKDENGKYIALLANEIGEYSGKKTERLSMGIHYLEITADGDWTISIA